MATAKQYFYLDLNGDVAGPCPFDKLWRLHLAGQLPLDTQLTEAAGRAAIRFGDLLAVPVGARPGSNLSGRSEGPPPGRVSFVQRFAEKAEDDLQMLIPHLLVPWREMKHFQWLDNRKLASIAAVGLLPLFIYAVGAESGNLRVAYWAIAFYFSALWALFFYHIFPAPHVTVRDSLICFFGTGVLSVSILLLAYQIPPFSTLLGLVTVANPFFRLLGFVFGVGVPEETCKVLVLFWLWQRRGALPPQTMLFYGLMAGLGFGIYEGVDYQSRANWVLADKNPHEFYLLNLIRLTTLPFLHAIWTGIAGYFLGFAGSYPTRKRGLILIAILLPAVLHGAYDTMGTTIGGIGCALLSIVALVIYLAKSVDFEKALRG